MNKETIVYNLIEAFKYYTIGEIKEYTQDGDKIIKILTDKYGTKVFATMTTGVE